MVECRAISHTPGIRVDKTTLQRRIHAERPRRIPRNIPKKCIPPIKKNLKKVKKMGIKKPLITTISEDYMFTREINKIAKNQLSHTVDLPPKKQLMVNGRRFLAEFPMNPMLMEHVFPSSTNQSYLPEKERTYVTGRDFTIA